MREQEGQVGKKDNGGGRGGGGGWGEAGRWCIFIFPPPAQMISGGGFGLWAVSSRNVRLLASPRWGTEGKMCSELVKLVPGQML